jgi:hypothetical protein
VRARDLAKLDVGLDVLPFPGRTAHRSLRERACGSA